MDECTVGFAITGSFCTFARAFAQMERLVARGYRVLPIFSPHAAETDTRFGRAADWIARAEAICGRPVLRTLTDVEPIGPKKWTDVLLVAPCTGNTAAKLAQNIIDTPVTLAVKSHLRGRFPLGSGGRPRRLAGRHQHDPRLHADEPAALLFCADAAGCAGRKTAVGGRRF